jgi:hypothetical protein
MNKSQAGLMSYNGKIEVHNSLLDAVLRDKPLLQRDQNADIPRSTRSASPLDVCARGRFDEGSILNFLKIEQF